MHAFGEIYQMYGPDWHDKKEKVCEHMIDKARCDEYFGEHTEEYEATSTVSILMAR